MSHLEDKESTNTLRMIIAFLSVISIGAFSAMYFFTGSAPTEKAQTVSTAEL